MVSYWIIFYYWIKQLNLCLLFDVSSCCNCLTAVSASPDVRTAFLEEEVSLSCLNSTLVDMSTYRVRWMKTAGNTNGSTIFEWPSESLQTDKVVWKADGDGNMCVFLKNPGQLDAGLYTEEVWKGWKLIEKKYIQLKVKCNFFLSHTLFIDWSMSVFFHLSDLITFQIAKSFRPWWLHRATL